MSSCQLQFDVILSTEWAKAASGQTPKSFSYRLCPEIKIQKTDEGDVVWWQTGKPDERMPISGSCVMDDADTVFYTQAQGIQEIVARLYGLTFPPASPSGGVDYEFTHKGYDGQPRSTINWRAKGKWVLRSSDWLPVSQMPVADRLEEAIKRALPHLAPEARGQVEGLLSPAALGAMAAIATVWLYAQAFGVGEIADAILLVVGAGMLGWSAFTAAQQLYDFVSGALNAKTEQDLDQAGKSLADAIALVGVAVVTVVLTHRVAVSLRARLPMGNKMPAMNRPLFYDPVTIKVQPGTLGPGVKGLCFPSGDILVAADTSEEEGALLHEGVHRWFSPRFRLLRQLRGDLKMTAYNRSVVLRYLEEALAETRSQMKECGVRDGIVKGFRFPIDGKGVDAAEDLIEASRRYRITADILQSSLKWEVGGAVFGVVVAAGVGYTVYLSQLH